jgi:isocitrate dehydrogenase (NAD+)
MKLSDGLFLDSARKISRAFPDIEYQEMIVDNCCMQLVMRPQQFDMLLLENLYGDIVSDLAAGLVGGLGLVPGANLGEHCALFEAVHGSAPDIAGKHLANPTAMILSAVLMLRHLEQHAVADRVEKAVHSVFQEGRGLTRDCGGTASTDEFTSSLIGALA